MPSTARPTKAGWDDGHSEKDIEMRFLRAARPAAALALIFTLVIPPLLAGHPRPAIAQTAQPQIDAEKLKAARDLLQATNADAQFTTVIPLIFRQMRRSMPTRGPNEQQQVEQVFAEIEKQFMARRGELMDKIAVLYASRFTAEELNTVSQFYQSPVGKKFIAAAPELATQAMKIGNDWGQKIGQEAEQTIRKELQKRGLKL
jgi:hypothetical protein